MAKSAKKAKAPALATTGGVPWRAPPSLMTLEEMLQRDAETGRNKVFLMYGSGNPRGPAVARILRDEGGFVVYDSSNPPAGPVRRFSWGVDVRDNLSEMSAADQVRLLQDPNVLEFVDQELSLIRSADCGVLVLPAGDCEHIKAGMIVALGKPLFILLNDGPLPEIPGHSLSRHLPCSVCGNMFYCKVEVDRQGIRPRAMYAAADESGGGVCEDLRDLARQISWMRD